MILASIKPYYYYLIAEEKKKIEVRKTALKNLPQDIAFYMSKDEKSFAKIPKEFQEKYREHFGKIGMRVVCDETERFSVGSLRSDHIEKLACLSYNEMINYFYKPEELDGKTVKQGFAWHISDLKIYDKPRELSEFIKPCPYGDSPCQVCEYYSDYSGECRNIITRPPQSYMRVKELKEV